MKNSLSNAQVSIVLVQRFEIGILLQKSDNALNLSIFLQIICSLLTRSGVHFALHPAFRPSSRRRCPFRSRQARAGVRGEGLARGDPGQRERPSAGRRSVRSPHAFRQLPARSRGGRRCATLNRILDHNKCQSDDLAPLCKVSRTPTYQLLVSETDFEQEDYYQQ